MPLIHFQERFASAVASGAKRQTIRKERKRPIEPGDRLILGTWEGKPYRSKVRRLREAECSQVEPVRIGYGRYCDEAIIVSGRHLTSDECDEFAEADGFTCLSVMLAWFGKTHGLPFRGVLIQW